MPYNLIVAKNCPYLKSFIHQKNRLPQMLTYLRNRVILSIVFNPNFTDYNGYRNPYNGIMFLPNSLFITCPNELYIAEEPQKIPTQPAIIFILWLPVKSPAANRKNNIAKDRNTTCSPLLCFNVPINMPDVNIPHRSR